ncbi:MAG: hypothetical protein ACO309_06050, partial [Ilumatobacteraceae bacterium]
MPFTGVRSSFLVVVVALGMLAGAQSASAQVSDDLGVIGQLQYQDANGVKVFVEGVDLSIDDVGGATTDKDGSFRIEVEGPGEYTINIDVATLPTGISLRDPERSSLQVTVSENGDQRIIFPLVSSESGA